MAINYSDIKLMKSQRLDDSSEGGGMMTGEEVIDGQVNNLFPDISRLDRTYGRVQLRKAFPAVFTETTNPYYGGHLIVTKPAEDANVKCCMFTTKSSTDMREDAVERVEDYVVKGYRLFNYMLMGKHVAGTKALLVQQNTTDDLPSSNSVLYLEESGGSGAEYVKIQKVTIKSTDTAAKTRQIELTLWTPTQYDHNGFHYDSSGRIIIDTYFYTTVVADATHYYGIAKLTQTAQTGDENIKVDDIFNKLVPCAQSSGALSNRDASMPFGEYVSGRNDDSKITVASGVIDNSSGNIYCEIGLLPGSITITDTTYSWTGTDDSNGNITGTISGTVDYNTGVIIITGNYESGHSYTVTATPAAQPNQKLYTIAYPIAIETQTTTFTRTIAPYPKAGSFFVKFMAQGDWYTLKDNGDGTISGTSPSYGSGTIDYESANFNITIGALPDIGSTVIFGWGTTIELLSQGNTTAEKFYIDLDFTNEASPNTLQITYTAGGVTKTVTDDGKGNLQGDGTGEVHYSTKHIKLYPDYLPDVGTAISVQYSKSQPYAESLAVTELTDNGDTWTATLSHAILAGSFELSYTGNAVIRNSTYIRTDNNGTHSQEYQETVSPNSLTIKLKDDGNGKLLNDANSSIDYANGTVTFSKEIDLISAVGYKEDHIWTGDLSYVKYKSTWSTGQNSNESHPFRNDAAGTNFTFNYSSADTATTATDTITDYNLTTILVQAAANIIVGASVLLEFTGEKYIDRDGKIYKGINANTGEIGAEAGAIDYTGGEVDITSWTSNAINAEVSIDSLISVIQRPTVSDYFFTTDACPIQVGSLQILFDRADTGEHISIMADNSGNITGSGVVGSVDYQTGIVALKFGEWVADDADAQAQPWYDTSLVENGQVLKPIEVFVDTIKYNAVAIEYIPLDSSILGLNPLRLPTDGRVPIFRDGDVAVIHNIQQFTMPDNLQEGQQISLPRGDLSFVDLFDQNGVYIDKSLYSIDLTTGVITMATPLDLAAYTQPLIAYHRREDMRLLTDVQIDGTLKLIQPIEHDYDTDYTYISSALLMGDLYGSIYNVFDQKSWTGAWSNDRIGDPCTANYDLIDYPIQTTNKGAIAERWAIIFTSSTDFKVVGEVVGEIATGNTSADCAPINPATQTPYFTIRHEGWGGGWATNNVLRFNTTAAHYPIWFVRTVLIGDATAEDDSFRVQIRGDAD